MPSGFATLDTNFPKLDGMSNEQRIQTLTSYLYQLLENLRYVLNNLGEENINESTWKKITNAAVFTALGQEGATIINGANISTGSINADLITTGELQGITIRGVDVYGSRFHNEDGTTALLLDYSPEDATRLHFGMWDSETGEFIVDLFNVESWLEMTPGTPEYANISLLGKTLCRTTRNSQSVNDGFMFPYKCYFPGGIDDHPTTAEVQAMIDASIAAANGGA